MSREGSRLNSRSVPGMTESELQTLKKTRINTLVKFRHAIFKRRGREKLEKITHLPKERLRHLANNVELLRVKRIKTEGVLLLREAGVTTLSELSQKNPVVLLGSIAQANDRLQLVEKNPTLFDVCSWVQSAQGLSSNLKS